MTARGRPGDLDPTSLAETRVALHHAALLVSAVGRSLGGRQPGFRHAALSWDAEAAGGAFVGWPIVTSKGSIRAALRFDPPAITVGDDTTIPLAGSSVADVTARLRQALDDAGAEGERLTTRLPADLPRGPTQTGEPFEPDDRAAAELGRWFGLANTHLVQAASAHEADLPVPCWPDHFDLAVVVHLPPPAVTDGQITLGFSPGDGTIPEPYFYVTAWPMAPGRAGEVPAPAGGRWQVEGWSGLALPASVILAASDQAGTIAGFLTRGFGIGRDLVGVA